MSLSVRISHKTRCPTSIFLRVSELVQPFLVDPEIMGQLMENRDSDLLFQFLWIRKRRDQGSAEDRDLVGHERVRLPEPEEVRIVRALLRDDHGDVLE